ncbi:hypothetical protein B9G39_24445 [Zooshikella ganghwensis]|uniref:Uncharacterized protein n=1 Tax=Zooshikella ganghwensis TaxID=202772 RepID=A0A4P9VUD9_9GAMM|nr:hypothetical protein B9G39_24445 [Zooshikella ganghwensis]
MMVALIQIVRKNITQYQPAHGKKLWLFTIFGKVGIHTAQKAKQKLVLNVGHFSIQKVVANAGHAIINAKQ